MGNYPAGDSTFLVWQKKTLLNFPADWSKVPVSLQVSWFNLLARGPSTVFLPIQCSKRYEKLGLASSILLFFYQQAIVMFPLFSLLSCKYLIIYHRFPIFRMGKYRVPYNFQITFSLLKYEFEFLLTEEALQLQNSCCYYNALWKCEHYEFSLLDWLFNWKSLWDVLCVNTAVFGQTMRLDSWGVLSRGCLVTESQRVLGKRQSPICSVELW